MEVARELKDMTVTLGVDDMGQEQHASLGHLPFVVARWTGSELAARQCGRRQADTYSPEAPCPGRKRPVRSSTGCPASAMRFPRK